MRKLLLISGILLIAFCSCKTDTRNPIDIINSSDITMTIEYGGCMSSGTRTITIREIDGIRTLTAVTDSNNELDISKKTIPFNTEKEIMLVDLINAGNSLPEDGYCTSYSKYDIKTEKYKCSFEDNTCSLDRHLINLIK